MPLDKKKGGRPKAPKPKTEPFAFRATLEEASAIRRKAKEAGVRPGEFCRAAALARKLPAAVHVPELNREAWLRLANLAENLNRYAAAIAAGKAHGYPAGMVEDVAAQVQALRRSLLGEPP